MEAHRTLGRSFGKSAKAKPVKDRMQGSRVTERTWPSYPEMFALATTCVSTEPKVVALYVLLQLLESLNCSHRVTKKGGVCSGAASERNWAI